MAHHRDLILACLEAVGARSVAEVGAFAGDLTRVLVAWARETGGRVVAIDPSPQEGLVELAGSSEPGMLELVPRTSLEALADLDLPDVVIVDGDHNYYTVSRELALIRERAAGAGLPLLLFHDVCWPHARRDDYSDPDRIPAELRQPLVGEGRGIAPDEPGTSPNGLPYPRSAAHEGGARNGVLTAVKDFVCTDSKLRLAVVPAFFGLGALWHASAPWADGLTALLEPWNGNSLLAALEENRVAHLAGEHALRAQLWALQERLAREERVLRRLLDSSAFRVAERLSRLRVRVGVAPTQSAISRQEIRRALD